MEPAGIYGCKTSTIPEDNSARPTQPPIAQAALLKAKVNSSVSVRTKTSHQVTLTPVAL